MKLLFDFLPILLFFVAYKVYGIYAATVVAIAASLIQVTVHRIKNKRFETMHLITFFSILVLGSATLFSHNDIFIKWKPTILYWVLGIAFIASSIFAKKPMIQSLMEKSIAMPTEIWQRLNIGWSVFFILLGAVNLFVVYHYSTNTWVNFKLFGTLGLTLLFVVLQSLYMAKYIQVQDKKS
jgi:intracellular septation protein